MRKFLKKNKKIIIIITIAMVPVFLYYQNNAIEITKIDLKYDKLPQSFEGYKILHISDLHNKMFGKNQRRLVDKIKQCQPNIIVITGDSIDYRRYDEYPLLTLLSQIKEMAPTYFVIGNHEARLSTFSELENKITNLGVNVLRDEVNDIKLNDENIHIIGIDDPSFSGENKFIKNLNELTQDINEKEFTILLSHRPELLNLYSHHNIDLVFSGHAHGGQVRIPFIGGVVAPGQGFFPKYTSGCHTNNKTTMVISRGLGNSLMPQRLFNKPELVLVTLHTR